MKMLFADYIDASTPLLCAILLSVERRFCSRAERFHWPVAILLATTILFAVCFIC